MAMAAGATGAAAALGEGAVASYAEIGDDGTPIAIGIRLDAAALAGLPPKRNATSRCFDLDQNGQINATGECEGDYERRLVMPDAVTGRDDIPFGWVMLNWNPEGHTPPPWAPPHFDVHFYIIDQPAAGAIRIGGCGIFMHCEDFERAIKPVPGKYLHPEHANVKAAVGGMGNHLIDTRTPEFGKPPQALTHTWIFGAYDGAIIFYETMLTRAYLLGRPNSCTPIKLPATWQRASFYPTEYCIRSLADENAFTISLEKFVARPAD